MTRGGSTVAKVQKTWLFAALSGRRKDCGYLPPTKRGVNTHNNEGSTQDMQFARVCQAGRQAAEYPSRYSPENSVSVPVKPFAQAKN